ncbi:dihydrolipoamide dehydrogenase [Bremerella volcania]|uniref:Dihydrolipoamide dehydrogenase n=2 Tax=Bremerella volcania TaxID=2527984 RepID=A0A518C443_9BACT|nr:NAD(P)-binding domain-containing protein [Bremerella volcania]QDU74003.1 dihydrolipoamide dehydrogenase [Bremerella volcania]
MAVESPARIVIVGAGSIGIEAALYARFLGYKVTVLDSGDVGAHLRKWGHVRMFTPFRDNCTKLGKSALAAQHQDLSLPLGDQYVTAGQYLEQYLQPLAESDLVADCVKRHHTVLSIARSSQTKTENYGQPARSETPLVTLAKDEQGHEYVFESDIVLDCSGVGAQPNFIGGGGSPAVGELAARPYLETGLIDAKGKDAKHYANQQILVIGAGHSAATNICQLSLLARETLETHVTWVTREGKADGQCGPVAVIEDDVLPQRKRMAVEANRLLVDENGHLDHWPETTVKSIHYEPQNNHFHVTLDGKHSGVHTFDRVVANVGYRPNLEMLHELQLDLCPNTEGTKSLIQPEPNFYILGSKSYGRDSSYLHGNGLDQIRRVFAIIGGRESLDLYAEPPSSSNQA